MFGTLSRTPFEVRFFESTRMHDAVRSLVGSMKFDVVHINLVRMAEYIADLGDLPVIVDHIDCLSLNMQRRSERERRFFKRTLFQIECKRMKDYETRCCRFPTIVTSEVDRSFLKDYANIKVVPNGVDTEYFRYSPDGPRNVDILFVGNMRYFPNVQGVGYFADHILPAIRERFADIRFFVVGANPGRSIRSLDDGKSIVVKGYVPDVREYLQRAKLFVAPLQSGSGIQNKILEAMASGTPVVSTTIGNLGIGAVNEKEILIADEPHQFARRVGDLLVDGERRKRLSHNAKQLVDTRFSWESRREELEVFYGQAIENRRRCQ